MKTTTAMTTVPRQRPLSPKQGNQIKNFTSGAATVAAAAVTGSAIGGNAAANAIGRHVEKNAEGKVAKFGRFITAPVKFLKTKGSKLSEIVTPKLSKFFTENKAGKGMATVGRVTVKKPITAVISRIKALPGKLKIFTGAAVALLALGNASVHGAIDAKTRK